MTFWNGKGMKVEFLPRGKIMKVTFKCVREKGEESQDFCDKKNLKKGRFLRRRKLKVAKLFLSILKDISLYFLKLTTY